MSSHVIDDAGGPARTRSLAGGRTVWRGLLLGLIPLGLLACMVAVTVLFAALTRNLWADAGFFAQQQAEVIVVCAGLLLSLAVFGVAVWRTLRRVTALQQAGAPRVASAALWTLAGTALVIVFPVVLAWLLPQHPFP